MARTLREAFYQSAAYPPYFRAVRAAQALRHRTLAVPLRVSNRLAGEPALPSGPLIKFVTGSEDLTWFLLSGRRGKDSIEDILKKNGQDIRRFGTVLDFGCGVGRVIRHWHRLDGPVFLGTDYNPRLVAWCRSHLTFASFKVNTLVGELSYPNAHCDLIYALSVFTHLTEPQQDFWIEELSRVLKPGGYLLISTHGEFYRPEIPADQQAAFDRGERVVCGSEYAGTNVCAAYHPPAYVLNELVTQLSVVDFVPQGALGNPRQDYWRLRKPAVN